MKKWKRIVAFTLVGVLAVSTLSGCGKKAGSGKIDGKEVINIRAWQSGMGVKGLEKLIEAFEEKYPEYKVDLASSADVSGVTTAYGKEEIDTTDIYFALMNSNAKYSEPLDDLLDSKADGETKTLREKFSKEYLNLAKNWDDGKVYSLTYGGGVIGIVYNKALFEQAGIKELPRTTNELILACDTLYRNDITPWCHFKEGGYWHMMTEVFFMQYDGYDYYQNTFYACKDENGNSPSLDVLTRKDGRYETLKMYEKILLPEYVLVGSNSADHTAIQTRFIHGQAAMIVNGAWMSNEMASAGGTEGFGMMKTPVISSIVDKLTTVKKDSELSAIVEAIDAVTDGEKSIDDFQKGDKYVVGNLEVSKEDWDYIDAARNTNGMNYSGMGAYIPVYSEQKEGAKEFLRFMYSDEGIKIYAGATRVALPITMDKGELDTSSWSSFEADAAELMGTTKQIASEYSTMKHPIFDEGGAVNALANQLYIQYFTALNTDDRRTADELWNSITKRINSSYKSTWLPNIE